MMRKQGASFDLPIAVGLAASSGQVPRDLVTRLLFLGEISLEGTLRRIRGRLCMVPVAEMVDAGGVILPEANAGEAVVCTSKPVYGVRSLGEVFEILRGGLAKGARRAVEAAAGGSHNILVLWTQYSC
jgi:magnesium chelatase family protein